MARVFTSSSSPFCEDGPHTVITALTFSSMPVSHLECPAGITSTQQPDTNSNGPKFRSHLRSAACQPSLFTVISATRDPRYTCPWNEHSIHSAASQGQNLAVLYLFPSLSPHFESLTTSWWLFMWNSSQITPFHHRSSFLPTPSSYHLLSRLPIAALLGSRLPDSFFLVSLTQHLHINWPKASFDHLNSVCKTINHSLVPKGQHPVTFPWPFRIRLPLTFPDLHPQTPYQGQAVLRQISCLLTPMLSPNEGSGAMTPSKSWPPTVVVNTGLLQHSHTHLLTCYLRLLHVATDQ